MLFTSHYILPIFIIGTLFFLFRTFCIQVLPQLSYDEFTHLVYLPAGVRLLAVAIYGWIGILGIMLGWLFCHVFGGEKTLLECLYYGFISGFSAFIAVLMWQRHYRVNDVFEGITSRLVVYLVLMCAVISSLIRYVYLASIDPLTSFLTVFFIGCIGDILGSFIVLYAIKGGLHFYSQFVKKLDS